MRYGLAQEDEAHRGRKSKKTDGLAGPVSQSCAVKQTLPMGIITSYAIVVGAQSNRVAGFEVKVEPHELQEFQLFDINVFATQDMVVEVLVHSTRGELDGLDQERLVQEVRKFFNVPQEMRLKVFPVGQDGHRIVQQRIDENMEAESEEESEGSDEESELSEEESEGSEEESEGSDEDIELSEEESEGSDEEIDDDDDDDEDNDDEEEEDEEEIRDRPTYEALMGA
ncbi:hypothetical protein ElyMa_004784100 [Elysia marginata]|uniref:Uncharacterized protein n=1 Tax=Elysia marginata TaxID=1093978 RepID=A0AAV4IKX4_9GAST|nr:hypothetical protein ElyMa_004784100 [Elysia marginata]